jgi:hypothetical protein
MELKSKQIASIKCDDTKSMFLTSEKSKEVLERYVEDNPEYTYDIDMNYDGLYYDLYLYKKDNQ